MRLRRIVLISLAILVALVFGAVVVALQKPHPLGSLEEKVESQRIRFRSAIRGGFTQAGPVHEERVRLVAHDCRLEGITFAEVEQELVRLFPESAGWEWDDSGSGDRVAYLEREPATLAGRVELDDEGRYVRVRTTLESDWRDRVLVLLSGMKLIR